MELSAEQVARAHTRALRIIELAERHWSTRRRDEEHPLLWLRAARAAWAAGDGEEAAAWYRRAADGVLRISQRVGLATGTHAYYGELAVNAAALASGPSIVERVCAEVRLHTPQPRRGSRFGPGRKGELNVAGRAVVCAWAAWLGGAEQKAADLLEQAEREVAILPSAARRWWRVSRWPLLRETILALLKVDPAAVGRAVAVFDRHVTAGFRATHPASELVDETVILLAKQWQSRHPASYDPRGLRVLVEPGTVAASGTDG